MTKEQQALNTLKEKGYTNHFQPIKLEQQYPNEFKILQKLVDKATPKKVDKYSRHKDLEPTYFCPICENIVEKEHKYCTECGQRLEW